MNDDALDGIDERELAAVLEREYQTAENYIDKLRPLWELAQRYYEADSTVLEAPEGNSQIMLPDVQEAVDYMGQSVLRTFLSGERVVEFEATDESDEQAVDDATAAINYNFMKLQDGPRLLHDSLHDGLLKKLGVFKTSAETHEKVWHETQQFGSEDELLVYADQSGCEVESYEEAEDGSLIARLKHERVERRFIDYSIPVSRFKFSPNARHEDDADYLCHAEPKTRSELVEMGFDKDQVYGLPAYTRSSWDRLGALDYEVRDSQQPELEEVLLCEEYARIDLDGDGIAERVKVFRVEAEILIDTETGKPSIETVEEQPFTVFSPFPRPHQIVGYSLADKVMDIQAVRTYIARQLLDGMAYANMPRPIVDTNQLDPDTYNDLLSPIPGGPIRVRGGAASVQPYQSSFDVGKSLSVMEWMSGERESRTGITRLNQGLDADALNKTATGTALMQSQGQQGEEMIARQLAEAVGRLFRKKYRLMRKEGEPFKVKVDGQYRQVDPRTWPEDINVIVRVGLGSNSKDKRLQYRMALAPILAEGFATGQVEPKHLFKAVDGLVRDMGIGQGDDFWSDPDAPPEIDEATGQPKQKAEKPDPEMAKVQAEQQTQQVRLEGEQQLAELRLQLQSQEAEAKQRLARDQAEFDAKLADARAQREADLADRSFVAEMALAERRMAFEAQLSIRKADHAHEAKLSSNRSGGSLAV
jgi:hypothetical protein